MTGTDTVNFHELDKSMLDAYLDRLVGKIFKLLPLKEEQSDTLMKYHASLMLELTSGAKFIFPQLQDKGEFVSMICSLESLLHTDDKEVYRRKVFECINIVKKLK